MLAFPRVALCRKQKYYGETFKTAPIHFFFDRLRLFESADENVDLFAVMALLICLWKADIDNFGNMDKQLKDMKGNKDANATKGLLW
jgi:hypothetical protein